MSKVDQYFKRQLQFKASVSNVQETVFAELSHYDKAEHDLLLNEFVSKIVEMHIETREQLQSSSLDAQDAGSDEKTTASSESEIHKQVEAEEQNVKSNKESYTIYTLLKNRGNRTIGTAEFLKALRIANLPKTRKQLDAKLQRLRNKSAIDWVIRSDCSINKRGLEEQRIISGKLTDEFKDTLVAELARQNLIDVDENLDEGQ